MMRLLNALNPMGYAALSRSLQPVGWVKRSVTHQTRWPTLPRWVTLRFTHPTVWLFALLPAVATAQALPDPTKPPAEISAPVSQTVAPRERGLQSIIISPTHRAAIINGARVELGDPVGDATLVEIGEGYVVLRGAQGKRVLSLFPGVEILKKEVAPPHEEKVVTPVVEKSNPVKKPVKKKKTARKPATHLEQSGKEGEKK